jgi:hypothetical protein
MRVYHKECHKRVHEYNDDIPLLLSPISIRPSFTILQIIKTNPEDQIVQGEQTTREHVTKQMKSKKSERKLASQPNQSNSRDHRQVLRQQASRPPQLGTVDIPQFERYFFIGQYRNLTIVPIHPRLPKCEAYCF